MVTLTCFISKFLDTDDIDKFAKENAIIKPFYLGCYPANVQPKGVKNKCCWVWNTDENDQPGTHWICVVKDVQNIIFFDSFGKTPIFFKRKYWLDYFRSLRCNFTVYTQLQRQSFISRTCGVWCLTFLHSYYDNNDTMDTFAVKVDELLNNEVQLQTIAYERFPNMKQVYQRKCHKAKGQICKTYLETFKTIM